MKLRLSVLGALVLAVKLVGVEAGDRAWCKDERKQNVDWFIMYKVPKMQRTKANYKTPEGGEFVYVDANTPSTTRAWTLSREDVYDGDNPVAYTLAPLYETRKPTDLLYVVYNDQTPGVYNGTRSGHAKGVVMFDATTGIWLQHSVPKFVENLFGGRYTFPDNARENAQALMCVTFPASELNTIAKHLRMQFANVYESGGPQSLRSEHRQMDMLLKESFVRGRRLKLYVDGIRSVGGRRFISIAKRATLQVDVYSAVVTNETQDDLLVQSWRNGPGRKLDDTCETKFKVVDVDTVRLNLGSSSLSWSSTEDHSKWAVGINKPWFCFGSLNRMESQFSRGGEVLCMEHPLVSRLFRRSGLTDASC